MKNLEEKKNDPKFMQDYLKHALELEKRVFLWNRALETAENQAYCVREEHQELLAEKQNTENKLQGVDAEIEKQKRKDELDVYSYKRDKLIKKRFFIFSLAFLAVMIIVTFFIELEKKFIPICIGIAPLLFYFAIKIYITVIGGAFIGFFGLKEPETKEEKERRIQNIEENLKTDCYEQGAIRRKKSLSDEIDKITVVIYYKNMEISRSNINREDIKSSLKDAEKTLAEIYSLNVLPQKYRSFVAVAQLYEYLKNGVCTIVQGHGGIYSMYEHHLEIGLVIAKLDVIIRKLDAIIANQEVLHDSIEETNNILSKIDSDIQAGNQAFAEYSSASLAYQSQQAAALQWQNWNMYY